MVAQAGPLVLAITREGDIRDYGRPVQQQRKDVPQMWPTVPPVISIFNLSSFFRAVTKNLDQTFGRQLNGELASKSRECDGQSVTLTGR